MRSGRKKARGGKPRFEVWLRERGLRWEAERWRYHAALEQERHSPPPREPETGQGADAMSALRMRANGHSREAVEETIHTCAPTIRDTQTGIFVFDRGYTKYYAYSYRRKHETSLKNARFLPVDAEN